MSTVDVVVIAGAVVLIGIVMALVARRRLSPLAAGLQIFAMLCVIAAVLLG